MNYGQIKQNLISLGFADDSDYNEFEQLGYTYDAINRAISTIGGNFPYIATYEFEIDDDESGIYVIDMADRDGFLELATDTPIVFEENGEEVFRPFGNYKIKMNRVLYIDADGNKGSFRIYYNKQCTQVDVETDDTFVPELPLLVHHLIPLLAAYYLWLDDDPAKAAQYYNMYESELSLITQRSMNKPRMRVVTDWGVVSRTSDWRY